MWLPFIVIAALLAAVVKADTPWTYNLASHSPTIAYTPYSDGKDPKLGWTIWTTTNGFNKADGQTASGDILHITSLSGATFTLTFYGTGITLYGESNATHTVALDNKKSHPPKVDGIIFAQDKLPLSLHYLTLSVDDASNGRQLSFLSAAIVSSSPQPLTPVVHNYDAPEIKYTGNWTPFDIPEAKYVGSTEFMASASLTFKGARAVAVHSTLNFGHWLYDVQLDGVSMKPPAGIAFNGSSWWLVPDSILFFADNLDDTKEHTIKLVNTANQPYWRFTLTSIETWQVGSGTGTGTGAGGSLSAPSQTTTAQSVQSNSNSKTLTGGVVAGIVVGIIAFFVLLGLGMFFLLRSRRRSKALREQDSSMPYPATMGPPSTSAWSGSGSNSNVLYVGPPMTRDRKGRNVMVHTPPGSSAPPTSTVTSGSTTTDLQFQHPASITERFDLPPPSYRHDD